MRIGLGVLMIICSVFSFFKGMFVGAISRLGQAVGDHRGAETVAALGGVILIAAIIAFVAAILILSQKKSGKNWAWFAAAIYGCFGLYALPSLGITDSLIYAIIDGLGGWTILKETRENELREEKLNAAAVNWQLPTSSADSASVTSAPSSLPSSQWSAKPVEKLIDNKISPFFTPDGVMRGYMFDHVVYATREQAEIAKERKKSKRAV